ncbi:unnamed protein product [Owenia fusiformis]|uniref:Uncharacterized protein n=1 Tax=Owenia fusiformis TaxID=6347 RepID=A0A8S4Q7N6_OWEFU|nr:unnamed protein product [Owenia fusiformis]
MPKMKPNKKPGAPLLQQDATPFHLTGVEEISSASSNIGDTCPSERQSKSKGGPHQADTPTAECKEGDVMVPQVAPTSTITSSSLPDSSVEKSENGFKFNPHLYVKDYLEPDVETYKQDPRFYDMLNVEYNYNIPIEEQIYFKTIATPYDWTDCPSVPPSFGCSFSNGMPVYRSPLPINMGLFVNQTDIATHQDEDKDVTKMKNKKQSKIPTENNDVEFTANVRDEALNSKVKNAGSGISSAIIRCRKSSNLPVHSIKNTRNHGATGSSATGSSATKSSATGSSAATIHGNVSTYPYKPYKQDFLIQATNENSVFSSDPIQKTGKDDHDATCLDLPSHIPHLISDPEYNFSQANDREIDFHDSIGGNKRSHLTHRGIVAVDVPLKKRCHNNSYSDMPLCSNPSNSSSNVMNKENSKKHFHSATLVEGDNKASATRRADISKNHSTNQTRNPYNAVVQRSKRSAYIGEYNLQSNERYGSERHLARETLHASERHIERKKPYENTNRKSRLNASKAINRTGKHDINGAETTGSFKGLAARSRHSTNRVVETCKSNQYLACVGGFSDMSTLYRSPNKEHRTDGSHSNTALSTHSIPMYENVSEDELSMGNVATTGSSSSKFNAYVSYSSTASKFSTPSNQAAMSNMLNTSVRHDPFIKVTSDGGKGLSACKSRTSTTKKHEECTATTIKTKQSTTNEETGKMEERVGNATSCIVDDSTTDYSKFDYNTGNNKGQSSANREKSLISDLDDVSAMMDGIHKHIDEHKTYCDMPLPTYTQSGCYSSISPPSILTGGNNTIEASNDGVFNAHYMLPSQNSELFNRNRIDENNNRNILSGCMSMNSNTAISISPNSVQRLPFTTNRLMLSTSNSAFSKTANIAQNMVKIAPKKKSKDTKVLKNPTLPTLNQNSTQRPVSSLTSSNVTEMNVGVTRKQTSSSITSFDPYCYNQDLNNQLPYQTNTYACNPPIMLNTGQHQFPLSGKPNTQNIYTVIPYSQYPYIYATQTNDMSETRDGNIPATYPYQLLNSTAVQPLVAQSNVIQWQYSSIQGQVINTCVGQNELPNMQSHQTFPMNSDSKEKTVKTSKKKRNPSSKKAATATKAQHHSTSIVDLNQMLAKTKQALEQQMKAKPTINEQLDESKKDVHVAPKKTRKSKKKSVEQKNSLKAEAFKRTKLGYEPLDIAASFKPEATSIYRCKEPVNTTDHAYESSTTMQNLDHKCAWNAAKSIPIASEMTTKLKPMVSKMSTKMIPMTSKPNGNDKTTILTMEGDLFLSDVKHSTTSISLNLNSNVDIVEDNVSGRTDGNTVGIGIFPQKEELRLEKLFGEAPTYLQEYEYESKCMVKCKETKEHSIDVVLVGDVEKPACKTTTVDVINVADNVLKISVSTPRKRHVTIKAKLQD